MHNYTCIVHVCIVKLTHLFVGIRAIWNHSGFTLGLQIAVIPPLVNNQCKYNTQNNLTLDTTSVLAPLVNRISTASILPFLTALNNGVLFIYKYNTK